MSKKIPLIMAAVAALGTLAAGSGGLMAHAQTMPIATSGYVQINNLTVTGISPSSQPAQILAADLSYPTITENGTVIATTTAAVTCAQFPSASSPVGSAAICPAPLLASTSTPPSAYHSPYTLEVDSNTQLLLSDRSPALFADFAVGDTINVYGYLDTANGTIDAEIVRDLSEPSGSAAAVTTTTTAIAVATSPAAIATLQTYIAQLATLIAQLQGQLSSGVVTTSTASSSLPAIPPAAY